MAGPPTVTAAVAWDWFAGASPLRDLREALYYAGGAPRGGAFLMCPRTLSLFRRATRGQCPYWLMPGTRGTPLPPVREDRRVPPRTVWLCDGGEVLVTLRV